MMQFAPSDTAQAQRPQLRRRSETPDELRAHFVARRDLWTTELRSANDAMKRLRHAGANVLDPTFLAILAEANIADCRIAELTRQIDAITMPAPAPAQATRRLRIA